MSVTDLLNQEEALVAELYRLGIRHLARLQVGVAARPMPPEDLLAALASHSQARIQASLILVFLRHPQLSGALHAALERLGRQEANALRLYYQAAVYLQRELEPELRGQPDRWQLLPDWFSKDLGLPPAQEVRPEAGGATNALAALGEVHRRFSGWGYNWAASYRQNIPWLVRTIRGPDGHLHR